MPGCAAGLGPQPHAGGRPLGRPGGSGMLGGMARRVAGDGRQVRLGTIYAAHGASHGFVLVLPAVLVALRSEFGVSFTTLGTVATVGTMLYGLGALPAGLLADRVGAPVLLRVFAGGSAICCGLA